MKLNIYNKREIIKTYEVDKYDLTFGIVEDVVNLIDIDKLKTGSDEEIIQVVAGAVVNGLDIIKPFLKDIFDGLTDEEIRNTRISELVTVLFEVVKYSINELSIGIKGKN